MVEYFRPKVRPGAGWTYPTGVGPTDGFMPDPNLFYSHVGLGVGSKDFPPYTKAPMHNFPSYVGQVDVGSPYKDVYKKYDVSSKPSGFHHEQQNWVDMQILNSPLNTQGLSPERVYENYMGLGLSKASEKIKEKSRNKAGRIIEEARASARETRPELFTEPAASADILGGAEIPLIGGFGPGVDPGEVGLGMFSRGEAILPSQSVSNEILPDLRSEFPGLYERSGIEAPLVTYGDVIDRPGGHRDVFDFSAVPPPVEAPQLLQQSGEPTSTVPIDQVNRDFAPPTDLVGGSFFSGGDPRRGPAIPGSGYLYSHPVLKAEAQMPFSELSALAREDAPWQKYIGPAMTAAVGSQIPGAGLLGLFAAGLNKLGAYHQFNPATDSNLFADPETGRATWGTTDPGGVGSQRGTLNLYNMLQDFGGSYPTRQVQTPSRFGPTGEIPQYANARDLAYIMHRGDKPPPGLYSQQTPLGYQDFGGNVTNQEALNTYNRTGAGAILNEAAEILGPGAGYNETSDLAEAMADDLQGQMDFAQSDIAPGYSGEDWGYW